MRCRYKSSDTTEEIRTHRESAKRPVKSICYLAEGKFA